MITRKEDHLLRWEYIESEQNKSVSRDHSATTLELCDHAIADELREMDLGKAQFCEYRPQFQVVLSPVLESFKV